jgi:hypothetical protein
MLGFVLAVAILILYSSLTVEYGKPPKTRQGRDILMLMRDRLCDGAALAATSESFFVLIFLSALQQGTDRTLHHWFEKVIAAKDGRVSPNPPRLTSAEKQAIKTIFQNSIKYDNEVIAKAAEKGYTVAPGDTATKNQVIKMVEETRFCPATNVLFDFSSGPNCFSPNRLVFPCTLLSNISRLAILVTETRVSARSSFYTPLTTWSRPAAH